MRLYLIFITLLLLLLTACTQLDPTPTSTAAPTPTLEPTPQPRADFPLEKGAAWVYEGTVKWQEGSEVLEDNVTWSMEVIDTVDRLHVKGYLLQGIPLDLAWYEPGKAPGTHVIVQVGTKYFYGDETTWSRLQDPDDLLLELVTEGDLFLDLPLQANKYFGETAQITRSDFAYFWVVEGAETVSLENVKGADSQGDLTQYTLAFRTLPDHQLVDFVPGVGITHYVYVHHGTVSEADVRLVEFRAGQ
ncbi:MAG: hypothetical protein KDI62_26955 [Anaerolineae bacterium]|nr:hypothetical protein [Anaerolineae bacterium]MCB9108279.1 hypothetical protein [Anaerolineales bacterium]